MERKTCFDGARQGCWPQRCLQSCLQVAVPHAPVTGCPSGTRLGCAQPECWAWWCVAHPAWGVVSWPGGAWARCRGGRGSRSVQARALALLRPRWRPGGCWCLHVKRGSEDVGRGPCRPGPLRPQKGASTGMRWPLSLPGSEPLECTRWPLCLPSPPGACLQGQVPTAAG